jgi:hypothetical protein
MLASFSGQAREVRFEEVNYTTSALYPFGLKTWFHGTDVKTFTPW